MQRSALSEPVHPAVLRMVEHADRRDLRRLAALLRYASEGIDLETAWAAQRGGLFRMAVLYADFQPDDAITIFDIGAGDGRSAHDALRLFPNATVHSFEPRADAHAHLREHAATLPNWHVHHLALGAEAGARTLNVYADHVEASSFYDLAQPWREALAHVDFDEPSQEAVTVQTLDAVAAEHGIDAIDILKLDVQGAELDVLRGGERILQHTRCIIAEQSFIEAYHDAAGYLDVHAHLIARGFRIAAMENFERHPDGYLLQADCLYRRSALNA